MKKYLLDMYNWFIDMAQLGITITVTGIGLILLSPILLPMAVIGIIVSLFISPDSIKEWPSFRDIKFKWERGKKPHRSYNFDNLPPKPPKRS